MYGVIGSGLLKSQSKTIHLGDTNEAGRSLTSSSSSSSLPLPPYSTLISSSSICGTVQPLEVTPGWDMWRSGLCAKGARWQPGDDLNRDLSTSSLSGFTSYFFASSDGDRSGYAVRQDVIALQVCTNEEFPLVVKRLLATDSKLSKEQRAIVVSHLVDALRRRIQSLPHTTLSLLLTSPWCSEVLKELSDDFLGMFYAALESGDIRIVRECLGSPSFSHMIDVNRVFAILESMVSLNKLVNSELSVTLVGWILEQNLQSSPEIRVVVADRLYQLVRQLSLAERTQLRSHILKMVEWWVTTVDLSKCCEEDIAGLIDRLRTLGQLVKKKGENNLSSAARKVIQATFPSLLVSSLPSNWKAFCKLHRILQSTPKFQQLIQLASNWNAVAEPQKAWKHIPQIQVAAKVGDNGMCVFHELSRCAALWFEEGNYDRVLAVLSSLSIWPAEQLKPAMQLLGRVVVALPEDASALLEASAELLSTANMSAASEHTDSEKQAILKICDHLLRQNSVDSLILLLGLCENYRVDDQSVWLRIWRCVCETNALQIEFSGPAWQVYCSVSEYSANSEVQLLAWRAAITTAPHAFNAWVLSESSPDHILKSITDSALRTSFATYVIRILLNAVGKSSSKDNAKFQQKLAAVLLQCDFSRKCEAMPMASLTVENFNKLRWQLLANPEADIDRLDQIVLALKILSWSRTLDIQAKEDTVHWVVGLLREEVVTHYSDRIHAPLQMVIGQLETFGICQDYFQTLALLLIRAMIIRCRSQSGIEERLNSTEILIQMMETWQRGVPLANIDLLFDIPQIVLGLRRHSLYPEHEGRCEPLIRRFLDLICDDALPLNVTEVFGVAMMEYLSGQWHESFYSRSFDYKHIYEGYRVARTLLDACHQISESSRIALCHFVTRLLLRYLDRYLISRTVQEMEWEKSQTLMLLRHQGGMISVSWVEAFGDVIRVAFELTRHRSMGPEKQPAFYAEVMERVMAAVTMSELKGICHRQPMFLYGLFSSVWNQAKWMADPSIVGDRRKAQIALSFMIESALVTHDRLVLTEHELNIIQSVLALSRESGWDDAALCTTLRKLKDTAIEAVLTMSPPITAKIIETLPLLFAQLDQEEDVARLVNGLLEKGEELAAFTAKDSPFWNKLFGEKKAQMLERAPNMWNKVFAALKGCPLSSTLGNQIVDFFFEQLIWAKLVLKYAPDVIEPSTKRPSDRFQLWFKCWCGLSLKFLNTAQKSDNGMYDEIIYRFFRDTRPLLEELLKDQSLDVANFIVQGWLETLRTFEPAQNIRKATFELAGEEFSQWLLYAKNRDLPVHLKLQIPLSGEVASNACSSSSSNSS